MNTKSTTKEKLNNSVSTPSGDGFASLGLAAVINEAVRSAGYYDPTPIQRQAIPVVVSGRDVLGSAQTGTGKTAAFALPILHRLIAPAATTKGAMHAERERRGAKPIRTLVLAPTRELAAQIGESFRKYGKGTSIRCEVIFGGVGKFHQVKALRKGVDVLVATPGRLLDLIRDREVNLRSLEILVLDEADRMLDMGFIDDVRRIIDLVPAKRQTLLFSATMPEEIRELADSVLHQPVRVSVAPVETKRVLIDDSIYRIAIERKLALLLELLRDTKMNRVLVFTRTKHGADRLAKNLEQAGIAVASIHGNKSQAARERVLAQFKQGRTHVVVATDIAARGIDVKGLSHVVNYDLPLDPESYVHRIGRTGRAGESGIAISFCASSERSQLKAIERLLGRAIMRRELPEGFEAQAELTHDATEEAESSPARRAQAGRPRAQHRERHHEKPNRHKKESFGSDERRGAGRGKPGAGRKRAGRPFGRFDAEGEAPAQSLRERRQRDFAGQREQGGEAQRKGFGEKPRAGFGARHARGASSREDREGFGAQRGRFGAKREEGFGGRRRRSEEEGEWFSKPERSAGKREWFGGKSRSEERAGLSSARGRTQRRGAEGRSRDDRGKRDAHPSDRAESWHQERGVQRQPGAKAGHSTGNRRREQAQRDRHARPIRERSEQDSPRSDGGGRSRRRK